MKSNEQKEIKTSKKKIILSIIALIVSITGISYAAYNWAFTGQTNTLSTSDINLEFIESNTNIINIQNALPMGDNEGKSQAQVFDFVVTSTTTRDIDIAYTLNIQKLEVDSGYTQLQDNQIKVYLTDENNTQKVAPTLISNLNNYKLYTNKHSHDSTHNKVQSKYKLRVWINQNVNASNWNASTKLQYKFKIGLTSEEKERVVYPKVVYRYGTDNVSFGNSINPVSETKWIIKENDEEIQGLVYNTHEECTAFLTSNDIIEGQTMEFDGESVIYTCGEKTETLEDGIGDYTEDYTTLNKNAFLKHNISDNGTVESSEVCYILNNALYCLKGGDSLAIIYEENKQILNNSFGVSNCTDNTTYYECSSGSLYAHVYSNGSANYGNVRAGDANSVCNVYNNGNSDCDIIYE